MKITNCKAVILLFLLSFCINTFAQQKFIFEQPEMGSPFTITIYTTDSAKAAAIAAQAFQLADSLNSILSDYIDSSEINCLSATAGSNQYVSVSKPLFDIIQRAQQAAMLSNGAYDITIGAVVKLWRKARKIKSFPGKDSLSAALQATGYRYLQIDSIQHAIRLQKKGMQLDVGGLGKGFVAQAALDFLNQHGFNSAMVNAGGKITTSVAPGTQPGWLIAINAPEEKEEVLPRMLSLQNVAVSTSGDLYQHVVINSKTYSHIINPKTGIGLTHSKNVTAIARDGTTADWLSTACSIISTRKAMQLTKKIPGAAILITERKRGTIEKKSSALFENYYF